eukprot:CAMPEP_0195065642 /NCGR_PEP_ID=MMETSP0448-20130528/11247_1 /TAXON_ID=66468 /ORGANISM="Heterocapsa triquestra, Strain CCMP 448" /LENGTH=119 /DNA_ID=CAMNT_0040096771 /DNA_START=378 /DNA_END=733 /DNA_ORIENTATION=+
MSAGGLADFAALTQSFVGATGLAVHFSCLGEPALQNLATATRLRAVATELGRVVHASPRRAGLTGVACPTAAANAVLWVPVGRAVLASAGLGRGCRLGGWRVPGARAEAAAGAAGLGAR